MYKKRAPLQVLTSPSTLLCCTALQPSGIADINSLLGLYAPLLCFSAAGVVVPVTSKLIIYVLPRAKLRLRSRTTSFHRSKHAMGRRGLSAVGVAAAAMMQCPADSFLGGTGIVRQPLVQRNGSAPSGSRTVNNNNSNNDHNNHNGSPSSPTFHRARALPLTTRVGGRARAGVRRPAAWRLSSVRGGGQGMAGGGGGGGGAEEGAAAAVRRSDAPATGVER